MSKNKTIIIFLIKFFVTYFLLTGMYSFYLSKTQKSAGIFSCAPITRQVADHVSVAAEIFGFSSSVEQNIDELSIAFRLNGQHVINVVEGCNSVSIIILFLAFIIAFKGSVKDTFFYGLFGAVTIYLVNVMRIFLIAVLYQRFPEYRTFWHDLMFPAIIYGYIFLLWVVWVKYFSHYKELKNEQKN
ncbi:exosortase family protein XrtF [Namhaeicola litoreus]|uniref:Exosortase family protein XrtF n=1 Tax=Namhaeicola litoreus TaxID=1052145 RepID=A0ABW3Y2W0_9FLAO